MVQKPPWHQNRTNMRTIRLRKLPKEIDFLIIDLWFVLHPPFHCSIGKHSKVVDMTCLRNVPGFKAKSKKEIAGEWWTNIWSKDIGFNQVSMEDQDLERAWCYIAEWDSAFKLKSVGLSKLNAQFSKWGKGRVLRKLPSLIFEYLISEISTQNIGSTQPVNQQLSRETQN